jgi:sulfur relay (sulfurtransferase) DsrC/TusE family protein
MPQIELAGVTYEVDEDGFLQELDKWSESFARLTPPQRRSKGN